MSFKIKKNKLKIIDNINGAVMHGLRKSDSSFIGFGEIYFSNIKYESIKAWKRHLKMTMNLVVPVGTVKFVFYDEDNDTFDEHIIGKNDYFRITVFPEIWFGFKGLDKKENLVMNFANIEHNPEEVERRNINHFKYSW